MTETNYEVRLPTEVDDLTPYNEYFILVQDGREQKIRVHDYDTVYKIPGLYERVVSDMLGCVSQEVVPDLLVEAVAEAGHSPADLVVLDFGAGVGLVGAALARRGVRDIIGLDIVPEAEEAARRDYPGVYHAYYVEDICRLSPETRTELTRKSPNCLVCVSAMDIAHISPDVFRCAFNLIADGGWVAFNLKANFLQETDSSGFFKLISGSIENGTLQVNKEHTYCHRVLVDGTPMEYLALVGQKRNDIPAL